MDLRAGELLPRHPDRIQRLIHRQGLPFIPFELRVEEAHVEIRVVDDQFRIPNEIHKGLGDVGEDRKSAEEFLR